MADVHDHLPAAFEKLAEAMPATIRRLLVDNELPAGMEPSAALRELGINPERHMLTADNARVECESGMLDAAACAQLRSLVDNKRQARADSVDGAPDHQLPLSVDQLAALIGADSVVALCALPTRFHHAVHKPADIFVRRYTGGTRPWNPFHHDSAAVTVNVALCADTSFSGGRLVAIANGEVAAIERDEGEATIHDSRLLHGVTRITSGVRYSLILFFGSAEAAETAAEAAVLESFLATLADADRVAFLAELDGAVAPLAQALQREEIALEGAKAHAAPARAAIEQARREVAAAEEVLAGASQQTAPAMVDEAEVLQALDAARGRLSAAVSNAQAMREACFSVQVEVQRLRFEMSAVQAEETARLRNAYVHRLEKRRDDHGKRMLDEPDS